LEGVTTVVLLAGGGGLLLLKDRHPARTSGSSRTIKARRIDVSFSYAAIDIDAVSSVWVQ